DQAGRVALVEVEPTLEHDDHPTAEPAEEQSPDVPRRGRGGPARELGEGDRDRFLELVREAAEAGTQDDPDLRYQVRPRADGRLERVESGGVQARGDRRRGIRHQGS